MADSIRKTPAADRLRPTTFDDMSGQKHLVGERGVLRRLTSTGRIPSMIFFGPPGTGKTTLANIVASEMGANIRVTSGPAIERPGDLVALVSNLSQGDVLFIDEIHRLSRTAEEVLYSAMEDFAVDIVTGKGPMANSIHMAVPKFTLVGATTRAGQLSAPLRDRFGVSLRLELYSPEELAKMSAEEITALSKDTYPVRAAKILGKFLTDYTYEELLADCEKAYAEDSFVGGAAPLVPIHGPFSALELWHGPTAAFKDMALQIMPRLLSRALVKTGETRTALILVATSGDTGKAALEGYKDIDGIKIMVFYPVDGVSRVQKLQMATQTGSNVNVTSIRGNFDDAQSGVKVIFGDAEMEAILNEKGYFFSSANSINWGRLAPQIIYYISAYASLVIAINNTVKILSIIDAPVTVLLHLSILNFVNSNLMSPATTREINITQYSKRFRDAICVYANKFTVSTNPFILFG